MLTLKNVHKKYGIRRVLEGISLSVGEGQKVAIVGGNGSGKSTLLKITAGEETFEKGERHLPNRISIGYLPQETSVEGEENLLQYLERMAGIAAVKEKMNNAAPYLEDPHQLARYEEATALFERLGGEQFQKRAFQYLKGLRLDHIAPTRQASTLSGGEKRKLALTGVLLRGVDLLVLDEPTNNLDLPALLYLEKLLKKNKTTTIIASHDRAFLDALVTKVFEIDWFKRNINQYAGGWTMYAEAKAHALRRQRELFREQQEERSRLEDSHDQKKAWVERIKGLKAPDSDKMAAHFKRERATKKFDASAKAIVSRVKRLNKHDEPVSRTPPRIELGRDVVPGGDVILQQGVVGYAGGFQSTPIDLHITFGTRLALLGDNGTGKSTLIKTLTGEIPLISGQRGVAKDTTFGYFIQEHDVLPQEMPVFEYLKTAKEAGLLGKEECLFELSRFELAPDIVDDKLKDLSPGERVRIVLARLVLEGANVLVLDEPTNHLDLDAIESLELSLETFPGTLIVVSHDRTFLKNLAPDTRYTMRDGALYQE